jgi:hypothetical protein
MEKFNYATKTNDVGEFRMIDKAQLVIPESSYQRNATSERRVKDIADNWDWRLVGSISVAERNGKFFVMDGGHRVRAAKTLNGSIPKLPCMVYKTASVTEESKTFLGMQKYRTNVSAYDNHKAGVVAKDPADVRAKEIAAAGAYEIKNGGAFTFQAVSTLKWAISIDDALAETVFLLCSEIAQGQQIPSVVLKGIFWAEFQYRKQYRKSLLTDDHCRKLVSAGMALLTQSILV